MSGQSVPASDSRSTCPGTASSTCLQLDVDVHPLVDQATARRHRRRPARQVEEATADQRRRTVREDVAQLQRHRRHRLRRPQAQVHPRVPEQRHPVGRPLPGERRRVVVALVGGLAPWQRARRRSSTRRSRRPARRRTSPGRSPAAAAWSAPWHRAYARARLGVDAAGADPESPLDVTTDGFAAAGARLAALGLPTVLVHEGGYALDRLGVDTVAVLHLFGSPGRLAAARDATAPRGQRHRRGDRQRPQRLQPGRDPLRQTDPFVGAQLDAEPGEAAEQRRRGRPPPAAAGAADRPRPAGRRGPARPTARGRRPRPPRCAAPSPTRPRAAGRRPPGRSRARRRRAPPGRPSRQSPRAAAVVTWQRPEAGQGPGHQPAVVGAERGEVADRALHESKPPCWRAAATVQPPISRTGAAAEDTSPTGAIGRRAISRSGRQGRRIRRILAAPGGPPGRPGPENPGFSLARRPRRRD